MQRTTFYFATFCKKGLQKTIYGGLPLVLRFEKPEEKIAFLKSLFEETYISDIVGRHNIRNRAELEELLNILSSAISSLTNPTKLSATFKSVKQKTISKATITRYIEYSPLF